MKIDSTIDVDRAQSISERLQAVATVAEPALGEDEMETLDDAIEFIEDAGGIQYGERIMESPMTERVYRVTKWIDAGEGQVIALRKSEVNPADIDREPES